MSLCICKLKKSYHLSGKKQRKNCICHSHKCSKLYCRLCKSVCPFSVSTSDTLCHMHLSTHSSHSCKSLRKPGKHTSNTYTCNRLCTKQSDPCHIRDIIQSPKKRRCHDRNCKLRQRLQNRTFC